MTRQRAWQKQMRFEGRCVICGDPAPDSTRKGNGNGKAQHCIKHRQSIREAVRAKKKETV